MAAFNDSIGVIELLFECGAKKDDRNNYNYTSLHLAAMRNNVKTIKILLTSRANPNFRDGDNRTPYDIAHKANHKEAADLLKTVTKDLIK